MHPSVLEALSNGFAAGARLCVHADDWDSLDAFETEIADVAASAGKTLGVARAPHWSRWSRWWNGDRVANWLSRELGLELTEASELLRASPIHIRPRLGHNAGDPRKILGVMAIGAADVLLYDTMGMSPTGASKLHQYVARTRAHRCVVYRSCSKAILCPPNVVCLNYSRQVLTPGPTDCRDGPASLGDA